MASSLETDAKNRPLVPWYNLKRVFKAFQVWGGAFISSANDNKSFDVTTVRSVGCALPDQIMLSVKVKVHENSL